MFITFRTSLRVHLQMLTDTGKTKDVFIISTHPWFFKNVVADRTMKIFVDIFLKSRIIVAIFLFFLATSHSVTTHKLWPYFPFENSIAMITFYLTLQRRNEGLPKMQRAATQLINIQTFYSQRAVRLKIIVKYCHFCFEDLVFSKVCLDNFLV